MEGEQPLYGESSWRLSNLSHNLLSVHLMKTSTNTKEASKRSKIFQWRSSGSRPSAITTDSALLMNRSNFLFSQTTVEAKYSLLFYSSAKLFKCMHGS